MSTHEGHFSFWRALASIITIVDDVLVFAQAVNKPFDQSAQRRFKLRFLGELDEENEERNDAARALRQRGLFRSSQQIGFALRLDEFFSQRRRDDESDEASVGGSTQRHPAVDAAQQARLHTFVTDVLGIKDTTKAVIDLRPKMSVEVPTQWNAEDAAYELHKASLRAMKVLRQKYTNESGESALVAHMTATVGRANAMLARRIRLLDNEIVKRADGRGLDKLVIDAAHNVREEYKATYDLVRVCVLAAGDFVPGQAVDAYCRLHPDAPTSFAERVGGTTPDPRPNRRPEEQTPEPKPEVQTAPSTEDAPVRTAAASSKVGTADLSGSTIVDSMAAIAEPASGATLDPVGGKSQASTIDVREPADSDSGNGGSSGSDGQSGAAADPIAVAGDVPGLGHNLAPTEKAAAKEAAAEATAELRGREEQQQAKAEQAPKAAAEQAAKQQVTNPLGNRPPSAGEQTAPKADVATSTMLADKRSLPELLDALDPKREKSAAELAAEEPSRTGSAAAATKARAEEKEADKPKATDEQPAKAAVPEADKVDKPGAATKPTSPAAAPANAALLPSTGDASVPNGQTMPQPATLSALGADPTTPASAASLIPGLASKAGEPTAAQVAGKGEAAGDKPKSAAEASAAAAETRRTGAAATVVASEAAASQPKLAERPAAADDVKSSRPAADQPAAEQSIHNGLPGPARSTDFAPPPGVAAPAGGGATEITGASASPTGTAASGVTSLAELPPPPPQLGTPTYVGPARNVDTQRDFYRTRKEMYEKHAQVLTRLQRSASGPQPADSLVATTQSAFHGALTSGVLATLLPKLAAAHRAQPRDNPMQLVLIALDQHIEQLQSTEQRLAAEVTGRLGSDDPQHVAKAQELQQVGASLTALANYQAALRELGAGARAGRESTAGGTTGTAAGAAHELAAALVRFAIAADEAEPAHRSALAEPRGTHRLGVAERPSPKRRSQRRVLVPA